ncbi:MAG: GAF domain-containing protein, partial [Wenzhouxiangella sp.]|nr:GAF domain-containing protein [Wenzhouxiangella sp.]
MEGVIKSPATPRDESKRLQALHELGILDTPQEERFDRITRLVQATLGVPMSTISLVDSDRQWFKSRQNIDDSETPRDVSFCGHGILQAEIFEVSDASIDPRFSDNPLVTGSPHIRFYAGAPIATPDGHRIGMLCAISDEPRRLTERERLILRALADCVEAEINALEEKRLRTLLSHTQARTGKMLQAMPDIVLLIDQDGICLESNDHPDLLIPRSEIIGRRVSEALPPHLASQWQASFRQVLQQEGQVVFDYVLPLAKGPTYFEARLQWLNQNEVLALIRDVSVRKTSEDALTEQRRLTDSIQTAQSEFILANDHRLAFTALLADILALTNSEYGFIAEV